MSEAKETDKHILTLANELRFLLERCGAGSKVREKAIKIVLRGSGKCQKPCCDYGDPAQAVFEFASATSTQSWRNQ